MKNSTILGNSTLNVNRIGLGCMGMSEFYGSFNEIESINTLHKAIDLGVNFSTQPICTVVEQMKN